MFLHPAQHSPGSSFERPLGQARVGWGKVAGFWEPPCFTPRPSWVALVSPRAAGQWWLANLFLISSFWLRFILKARFGKSENDWPSGENPTTFACLIKPFAIWTCTLISGHSPAGRATCGSQAYSTSTVHKLFPVSRTPFLAFSTWLEDTAQRHPSEASQVLPGWVWCSFLRLPQHFFSYILCIAKVCFSLTRNSRDGRVPLGGQIWHTCFFPNGQPQGKNFIFFNFWKKIKGRIFHKWKLSEIQISVSKVLWEHHPWLLPHYSDRVIVERLDEACKV